MKTFAAAWRFLTIIPWFAAPGDGEAQLLRRSVGMFPLVGAVLGLIVAGLAWFFTAILPGAPSAALTVAAMAMVSGGFHLDGLADCGDALLSPGHDREKALAVMKDSRIGAHGALAMFLVLLLKFAALASLGPERMAAAAFAAVLAGRAAMLFPMSVLPYARAGGLGGLFVIEHRNRLLCWGALVGVFGVGGIMRPVSAGVAAVAALCVVPAVWAWYLRRRLGGATGDCYGAACELTETAVALAAAFSIDPRLALPGYVPWT